MNFQDDTVSVLLDSRLFIKSLISLNCLYIHGHPNKLPPNGGDKTRKITRRI